MPSAQLRQEVFYLFGQVLALMRFFPAHVGTIFVIFSLAFNLGNAQADFYVVQIHFNDFSFNNLANFQNIARSFDALKSDFGNVNQTFNFVAQFNDSAERQQTNNFNVQDITDVELRSFYLPWVFLSSFDAQSNTFFLRSMRLIRTVTSSPS